MTTQVIKVRLKQLFSTLAVAQDENQILLEGEVWNEKDASTGRSTGRRKIGDGVITANDVIIGTAFNDLPFEPISDSGPSLSDDAPQAIGAATAGTSENASRADHVHAGPAAAASEELADPAEAGIRSWSPALLWLLVQAWYVTQAPVDEEEATPISLQALLAYLVTGYPLPLLTTGSIGVLVAANNDPRFTPVAQPLGVQGNSAQIKGSGLWTWGGVDHTGSSSAIWLLTINSTSAFTLDVSDMPEGLNWWETEIIITTIQVPVSFSFTGNAIKCDVNGSTLANNAFVAGKATTLLLAKLTTGNRYTAQFSPAVTIT